jgi:hypothetical protein
MFVGFVLFSHFGREFNQFKLHANGFDGKTETIYCHTQNDCCSTNVKKNSKINLSLLISISKKV